MKLNLYRRHRPNCIGGHAWQSRSGELEERRKSWRKCDCLIHLSGTLGGRFGRKATDSSSWERAHEFATALAAKGSWKGAVLVQVPPPAALETSEKRVRLSEACATFLMNRAAAQIAPATMRKYRTFTKQLSAYAEKRGYVMLDQFKPVDVDTFYAGLKLGARAKGKRLGVLRAFFLLAEHRKWIAESPVSADIRPPVGSSRPADKMPFTDEDVARIIAACDKPPRPREGTQAEGLQESDYVGANWTNEQGEGQWTGEDLKDLILLLLHTGYRISDAVFFDMKRLRGNDVLIRARKNGRHVFGVLPDAVRDRLLARAKTHGARPFIVGRSTRLETVTNVWRRRLARAFDAAGSFEHAPTPHRFRHTFARILLQKGISVADVAELMGDDESTIRMHYAAWVPERQERLTRVLRDAFVDRRSTNPSS